MRLSEYVLTRIRDAGCDTIFGIYGSATGALHDGFFSVAGIKHIAMQHEQQAGMAAEGYAKTANRSHAFGCALATSGPGGQNLVTPIANCFYDSVPCLFLTGQVNTAFMRTSKDVRQTGFQECDITSIVAPITKAAFLVKRPADIKWVMDAALQFMWEGRPGPVLIDIPQDVQKAEIDPDKLDAYFNPVTQVEGRDLLAFSERIVDALSVAKRPVLLVGGGCRGTAIWEFARDLGIPTFPTWNALDLITSDHPYYAGRIGTYGGPGFNQAIQQSDFLLSIGSRISGRITGGNPSSFAPDARKFCIDIDPATLRALPFDAECFAADAGAAISAIRHALSSHTRPIWSEWIEHSKQLVRTLDPVLPRYFQQTEIHPYAFCRMLGEMLLANTILVGDCGGNIASVNHSLRTKRGQRYFTNNGNSPVGFSVSGAVGAHYAEPFRPVVAVVGDGGLMLNLTILETIAHNKLPIKIVVLNNKCYGITAAYNRTNFGGRQIANGTTDELGDWSMPLVEKLAATFGIDYTPVTTTEQARPAIEWLLSSQNAGIIDCITPGFSSYLPRISRGDVPIDQMELPS